MMEMDFIIWLLFMLTFAILPIKPIFNIIFKRFRKDTDLWVEEEKYGEKRYSQLYRPGDKKYNKIVRLSDNAKPID